ncbi:hypothetical protein [Haemophilus paraphrohaemolyticus]
MENKKYRLPEREWFSLEGAVKEIKKKTGEEIEIIDLLHFWDMGTLDLSVYIKISPFAIDIGKKMYRKKDITSFSVCDNFDTLLNETDKFKNLLVMMGKADANETIKFYEDKNNFKEVLALGSKSSEQKEAYLALADEDYLFLEQPDNQAYFFRGIFSILPDDSFKIFEIDLKRNKISFRILYLLYRHLTDNLEIKEDNAEIFVSILFKEYLETEEIDLDEIIITKEHLEQFLTGETNIDITKEREKFNQQPKISNTVKENQINFIKTLLFMEYGITTEEEARRELRSGRLGSRLEKCKRENIDTFESKNLIIPSDKTLLNWYKNS